MELRCLISYAILLFCLNVQGQTYQDCTNPYPVCELKTYHFEEMVGQGDFQDKLPELRCISNRKFKETNSKWLYLEVAKSGTLVFNIEGMQDGDDIDFVLFEMTEDCSDLKEVRCMASGQDMINTRNTRSDCMGNTGLSYTSLDNFEKSGCKYIDDNFLKFLSVEQDERYALLINNYNSEKGFSISFNGDCALRRANNCMPLELSLNISNLYPNPTSEKLSAQFNSISDSYTLQILDSSGKVFKEESGSCERGNLTLEVDVNRLISGMYILRISQAEWSTSKTFVKEN